MWQYLDVAGASRSFTASWRFTRRQLQKSVSFTINGLSIAVLAVKL